MSRLVSRRSYSIQSISGLKRTPTEKWRKPSAGRQLQSVSRISSQNDAERTGWRAGHQMALNGERIRLRSSDWPEKPPPSPTLSMETLGASGSGRSMRRWTSRSSWTMRKVRSKSAAVTSIRMSTGWAPISAAYEAMACQSAAEQWAVFGAHRSDRHIAQPATPPPCPEWRRIRRRCCAVWTATARIRSDHQRKFPIRQSKPKLLVAIRLSA